MKKHTLFLSLLLFFFSYTIDAQSYNEVSENSKSFIDFSDLFEEVEQFEEESFIIHLGSGFIRDIKTDLNGVNFPIVVSVEKAFWQNIGLGLKAGFRWWELPDINQHYQYYSLSIRGAYHINILEALDPYIGLATTARFITSSNKEARESNFDYDPISFVLGGRYYFTESLGLYLEWSPDGQANFHTGIVYKLN